MKVLVQNGTYMQILTKWGVQAGAIPASQVKINGANELIQTGRAPPAGARP